MTSNPLITIITPCYNSVVWIKRCVDSVLNQNFNNWEMVIIDDGSTDGTSFILDEYSKKDERIKVAHQVNHGCTYTNNLLLTIARGEYIFALDSDNWLLDNTLFSIVAQSIEQYHKPDFLQIPLIILENNSIIMRISSLDCNKFLSNKKEIDNAIENHQIHLDSHSGKFLKREILSKNMIFFVGDPQGADTRLNAVFLVFARNGVLLRNAGLGVENRNDSLSHKERNLDFYLNWISSELFLIHYYVNDHNINRMRNYIEISNLYDMYLKALSMCRITQSHKFRQFGKKIYKFRDLFSSFQKGKFMWLKCLYPFLYKVYYIIKTHGKRK